MNLFKMSCACTLTIISLSLTPALAQQTRQQPRPALPQLAGGAGDYEQTQQDQLRILATNINKQRSDAIAEGSLSGISSVYTDDAVYIELMPRLSVMNGKRQIEEHFRQLFAAHLKDLTTVVTTAQMAGNGSQIVGGDYTLTTGNKRVMGHFVQMLRNENGTWKISRHIFARPEPVMMSEFTEFRGQ